MKFAILACLFLFLHTSTALKCYVCSGKMGNKEPCETGSLEDSTLKDCTVPNGRCITAVDKDAVVRTCGLEKACEALNTAGATFCDECDKDKCNNQRAGAPISSSLSKLLGMSVLILAVLRSF